MKFPEAFSLENGAEKLTEFDCIIDVRSPSEFNEDHIPGAINCPVLNDEERIVIGTMYKQVGSFEAKKLGASLVASNIAFHLKSLFQDKPKEWRPLVYCWRGGNRSGSMAHIFAKIGWPVAQLQGGYKTYRQLVNQELPILAEHLQWRVLCGPTGSGKSRLLQILKEQNEQVLDLEELAIHRGSVLGEIPFQKQPSQKLFESRIWSILRAIDKSRPVYVEAESKKVGNLRVPESIIDVIRLSKCIAIHLPTRERVKYLIQEYAHYAKQPELLSRQFDYLMSLHGKQTINRWKTLAQEGNIEELVECLLEKHYDPAYSKSINRNFLQHQHAIQVYQSGINQTDFEASVQTIIGSTYQPSASSTIRCPS